MMTRGIGGMIKQLRERQGLSQRALAQRVKVTDAYIAMLETGKRKNPSLDIVRRLAKVLGVSVAKLVE